MLQQDHLLLNIVVNIIIIHLLLILMYYWNEASSNNESETMETINDRVNVSEDGRSLYFYELSSEDDHYREYP